MSHSEIKRLVNETTIPVLETARGDLLRGVSPGIVVEGAHDGERLTHVLAAILIRQEMDSHKLNYVEALRRFLKRVREAVDIS